MTQTSPQPTERVSSRQRRIEEQRRKIDAARREQRNRQLLIGAAVVGAVILVVALLFVFFQRGGGGGGDQMRQMPLEAGNHLQEGSPLTYRSRPPTSGAHYGTLPQASDYRFYDVPLSPGRWLHMLEHGAVVVLYRPDLCDDACRAQLAQVWDAAPRSNLVGVKHVAITPYEDMDHPVAVVAWGFLDEMDQVDRDRILADIRSKVDAPSAPERGAL